MAPFLLHSMKKKGCPDYHKVCKMTPVNKHLKKLVIDKLIFKHKCSNHKEVQSSDDSACLNDKQQKNKRKTK
jgi:hypothetical protein